MAAKKKIGKDEDRLMLLAVLLAVALFLGLVAVKLKKQRMLPTGTGTVEKTNVISLQL